MPVERERVKRSVDTGKGVTKQLEFRWRHIAQAVAEFLMVAVAVRSGE
jgi:hypothetical protein